MGPPDPAVRAQSISAILRTSRLANPRRESYGGREVIVFDFEPRPGYKPATTAEKFLSKSSGVMWVAAAVLAIVPRRSIEDGLLRGDSYDSLQTGHQLSTIQIATTKRKLAWAQTIKTGFIRKMDFLIWTSSI